ncbi:MAG: hypothetical protein ACI8P0_003922 [Planctomycetaceae bacterium]|jgi:hypothetical protein
MVRNIVADRPIEPPGRFVCCLVGLVEVVAMLTIIVGSMADFQADRSNAALCSAVADLSIADSAASTESGAIEEPNDVASTLTDLEKSMLGTWEDDYKGHRTLTLNADGTGRMVVELDGFAATLFARKLTFQEEWTVADGKVTMKATGGEPAGKVSLVLSLHGDSSTQRIVDVTPDRMILVEEPSETRFEWRRVSAAEPPPR